jgi:hypothetical protein
MNHAIVEGRRSRNGSVKRVGFFLHHVGRFSADTFRYLTPFPRIGRWVAHHVSSFVALITAAFTLTAAFAVWHYASTATQDRGNIMASGIAGVGTLVAAGIALYVAMLAQDRDEKKEHQRIRPVLSAIIGWTPPCRANGKLEVRILHEWGNPGYGVAVYLRPGHLPPEAYFPMIPQSQNPGLLSQGKAEVFNSERTGFADETGYYIYVRYFDILGWEWHTEEPFWLSLIGDTRKVGLGPYAPSIGPNEQTYVPLPVPLRAINSLGQLWGPESYDRIKTPSLTRRIENLWFNSRPRPPRITVAPPNYSSTGLTPTPKAGSPPKRDRSAYWNPRPANRYRRR